MENKEEQKQEKKSKKIKKRYIVLFLIIVVGIFIFINAQPVQVKKGQKVKLNDWEFTLLDFQYGKVLHESLSKEDYALPFDGTSNITAKNKGNVMAVITYKLKYTGKNGNREYNGGFSFDYDNGYILTDAAKDSYIRGLYIRNNTKEGTMEKNVYSALWDIQPYGHYEFKPLEKEQKIREYIEISEDILKDKSKSLKLIKYIGGKKLVYVIR